MSQPIANRPASPARQALAVGAQPQSQADGVTPQVVPPGPQASGAARAAHAVSLLKQPADLDYKGPHAPDGIVRIRGGIFPASTVLPLFKFLGTGEIPADPAARESCWQACVMLNEFALMGYVAVLMPLKNGLRLSGDQFIPGEPGLQSFITHLPSGSLQHLDITEPPVGSLGAISDPGHLLHGCGLESLHLRGCNELLLDPRFLKALDGSTTTAESIRSLGLHDCKAKAVTPCLKALQGWTQPLALHLSHDGVNGSAADLCKTLGGIPGLTSLSITAKRLPEDAGVALGGLIRQHHGLAALDVSLTTGAPIAHYGELLCAVRDSKLKAFNFHCAIAMDPPTGGARDAIVAMLLGDTPVRQLGLAAFDCAEIVCTLPADRKILPIRLALSLPRLNDAAMDQIGRRLKDADRLEFLGLNLRGCTAGEAGWRSLVACLSVTAISEMELAGIQPPQFAAQTIRRLIEYNRDQLQAMLGPALHGVLSDSRTGHHHTFVPREVAGVIGASFSMLEVAPALGQLVMVRRAAFREALTAFHNAHAPGTMDIWMDRVAVDL